MAVNYHSIGFITLAPGGQSCNLYLNVHFFITGVNKTSVAAKDSYFPALVSNTCCSNKFTLK
jgi:hypothetical protein